MERLFFEIFNGFSGGNAWFNADSEFGDRVLEKRNRIVDINYPFQAPPSWAPVRDSIFTSLLDQEIKNHPDLQLLTTNISEIRSLVNDCRTIKERLSTRGEYELPNLIKDADQLISLLKEQYHLEPARK